MAVRKKGKKPARKTEKAPPEKILIGKDEYTALDLKKNFRHIMDYFLQTPRSTPDMDLFRRFLYMLTRKRYHEQALSALEEIEDKYVQDWTLIEMKGMLLFEMGLLEEARSIFEMLIEKYPDLFFFHYEYMARILKDQGYPESAEEYFEKALQVSISDPGAMTAQFDIMEQMARLKYDEGDLEKALEYLQEILLINARDDRWELYFQILEALGGKGRIEEAEAVFRNIRSARNYFQRGYKYEIQQNWEKAIKSYKKAIEINPHEPHYYFCTASALESLPEDRYEFQMDEATAFYRKAVELFPNNTVYVLALAENLSNLGETEEAFALAAGAGHRSPELAIPSLRRYAEELGREPEYMNLLREYITEDPMGRFIEIRTELAIMLSDRKNEEAEKWFEETSELYLERLEREPYRWQNHFLYGCSELNLGNVPLSEECFVRANLLAGGFTPDVGEKLAEIYLERNMFEKAGEQLIQLIKVYRDDYDYYGKLGLCFLYEEKYEKAMEAFNMSLNLNRYIPEYLYGAGVASARLKNLNDTIAILKDLLNIDPGFIDIIKQESVFQETRDTREFLEVTAGHRHDSSAVPKTGIALQKIIIPRKKAGVTEEK